LRILLVQPVKEGLECFFVLLGNSTLYLDFEIFHIFHQSKELVCLFDVFLLDLEFLGLFNRRLQGCDIGLVLPNEFQECSFLHFSAINHVSILVSFLHGLTYSVFEAFSRLVCVLEGRSSVASAHLLRLFSFLAYLVELLHL